MQSQLCCFVLFLPFYICLELELTHPETLKNEAFGASHRTFQVIPQVDDFIKLSYSLYSIVSQQVYEMRVMPASAPQNLSVESGVIAFTRPRMLGGSNIKHYEVGINIRAG